jgi:hypothetical protein
MKDIPNNINLIWIGSKLRSKHKERLLSWKDINPTHEVNLWVDSSMIDSSTLETIQSFCNENSINICYIESLNISKKVKTWLEELKCFRLIPFAALADIYRIYILHKVGGWYFDTDIDPRTPLPINLNTNFGFMLYMNEQGPSENNNQQLKDHSPCIIASNKQSTFSIQGINIIEAMIANDSNREIQNLYKCTEVINQWVYGVSLTGNIIPSICTKLTNWYGAPLIRWEGSAELYVPNFNIFKKVASHYVLPPVKYQLIKLKTQAELSLDNIKVIASKMLGENDFGIVSYNNKDFYQLVKTGKPSTTLHKLDQKLINGLLLQSFNLIPENNSQEASLDDNKKITKYCGYFVVTYELSWLKKDISNFRDGITGPPDNQCLSLRSNHRSQILYYQTEKKLYKAIANVKNLSLPSQISASFMIQVLSSSKSFKIYGALLIIMSLALGAIALSGGVIPLVYGSIAIPGLIIGVGLGFFSNKLGKQEHPLPEVVNTLILASST